MSASCRNFFRTSDFDEDWNSNGAEQNCGFLRTPVEFGEVRRGIAKIGAEAPQQQLPVEHKDIVADGRGTGLGLFISRELCQTNGALLAYESRAGGGSVFRVIFADPQRWG